VLLALAASCTASGSDTVADEPAPDGASAPLSLRLTSDGAGRPVPLGRPVEVTVALRNDGPRSVSVGVELTLAGPGGDVTFSSLSLFVPFGEEVSESVTLTPAQWFADLGTYTVTAATDTGTDGSTTVEIGEPDVVVPVFDDVTEAAGLVTTVPPAECGQFANGAGWADVDGDGDLDLLLTRLGDPVQLFVADGAGHFTDEAAARGLAIGDANGVAFADYDNDGDTDVFLARDGSDLLLRNDGTGHFDDVSAEAGIGDPDWRGVSGAWGDYDGDGFVDLYVTDYMACLGDWSTEEEIISQVEYFPDRLYRNRGDGTFEDVTALLEGDPADYDDGTTIGAGFTAAWFDYDADGRPDLYLANDFVGPSPDHNRLWHNDGPDGDGWRFSEVSVATGTAFFINTMGIGLADVDRDLDLDVALSNVTDNKLLRNETPAPFVEEQTAAGVARAHQRAGTDAITWGLGFYDLDLDGWEDLYLAAGNFLKPYGAAVGVQPNELYVSDGTGAGFLDVSAATGADDPGESKGVAFADYDGDGDVDLFVVNQDGSPRLYANVTETTGHWLEVDTVGTRSNRDGCGAAVVATVGGAPLTRLVTCGSTSVASTNQSAVHFGLGPATTVDRLEVRWPSGAVQVLDDVDVDQLVTVQEEVP
jgi:enediyne biosynthesis protein E4